MRTECKQRPDGALVIASSAGFGCLFVVSCSQRKTAALKAAKANANPSASPGARTLRIRHSPDESHNAKEPERSCDETQRAAKTEGGGAVACIRLFCHVEV